MSDQLLYAMSTRTELGLDQFNDIFMKVYLPGKISRDESIDIDMRRQIVRSLDSLGYCEFDFSARMVYMCPPCILLLPSYGTLRSVFTGARTPSLIAKLKSAVRKRRGQALLSCVPQDNGNVNIPASIFIEAVSKETLAQIAEESGIGIDMDEPAPWKLANFSASINDIEKSLSFEKRQEPNWRSRIFHKDRLMFSKFQKKNQDSLELAEYINPVDQQRRHWLWNGELSARVERDWGRYITLSREGRYVMLYDKKLRRLAIPVTTPLPCLLARAISLCSGCIPASSWTGEKPVASIPANHPLHIYKDVPDDIAGLVAEKLLQNLVSVTLKNIDSGVSND